MILRIVAKTKEKKTTKINSKYKCEIKENRVTPFGRTLPSNTEKIQTGTQHYIFIKNEHFQFDTIQRKLTKQQNYMKNSKQT